MRYWVRHSFPGSDKEDFWQCYFSPPSASMSRPIPQTCVLLFPWDICRAAFLSSGVTDGLNMSRLTADTGSHFLLGLNGVPSIPDSRASSRHSCCSCTASLLSPNWWKVVLNRWACLIPHDVLWVVSRCGQFRVVQVQFCFTVNLVGRHDYPNQQVLGLVFKLRFSTGARLACWLSSRCGWSVIIWRFLRQETSLRQRFPRVLISLNLQSWMIVQMTRAAFLPCSVRWLAPGTSLRFHVLSDGNSIDNE